MNESKIKVSASIICANWMHLEADLQALEKGGLDYIHYDLMDSYFCPDYSLGTQVINKIRPHTKLPSDYHLMVEEPSRIFQNFEAQDGDILSIHYEACRNLHRDLISIKRMGFKPGLVLNPATPLEYIEYVIEELDVITIMTVNPGYSGQKLVPQTLKKVTALLQWRERDQLNFDICVDGNVNEQNIPNMIVAGADMLIAGSSGLFTGDLSLDQSIQRFHEYVETGLKKKAVADG